MRILILVLVLGIIMYLVTRQIEEVTPADEVGVEFSEGVDGGISEDASSDVKKAKGMYSSELNKAHGVEQNLQNQLDKRMEEVDALAR